MRILREALIALNVGFAIALGSRSYLQQPRVGRLSDKIYRAINNLLHMPERTGAADVAVYCGTLLLGTLVVALLLLSLRRAPLAFSKIVIDPLAVLLALAAVPTAWVAGIAAGGGPSRPWQEYPTLPHMGPFSFVGFEVGVVILLLYAVRRTSKGFGLSMFILTLHYGVWAYYMWEAVRWAVWPYTWLKWSAVVFPASGVFWLLHDYYGNSRVEPRP